ncbi:MAG: WYL domain-containing protein [Mariprofundaceae bacterium]|nr:WYL domain-containing protein [Mariprofundaceae bacterium]
MNDTLMRQWDMMQMIPRQPSKVSTTQLVQDLAAEGFNVGTRTIQRDLIKLSTTFPLVCDNRDKPYGWSWLKDSQVMNIPGMGTHAALAFYLAKKHLEIMLPKETSHHLKPHFDMAGKILDAMPSDAGAPAWRDKIRVHRRGQFLTPPAIQAEVQEQVYEALLLNRKIKVSYCGRNDTEEKEQEVNPLGIVLKDGLIYLVCSYWDYSDIRLMTLHRMSAAQRMDIPSKVPEGFNLDAYIASGEMDFSVGDEIHLKARISENMAVHLQERPLHTTQIISEIDDEQILLDVTVQDTNELRWWLLGFGDQVEILKPDNLREHFRSIAENMAKSYVT